MGDILTFQNGYNQPTGQDFELDSDPEALVAEFVEPLALVALVD